MNKPQTIRQTREPSAGKYLVDIMQPDPQRFVPARHGGHHDIHDYFNSVLVGSAGTIMTAHTSAIDLIGGTFSGPPLEYTQPAPSASPFVEIMDALQAVHAELKELSARIDKLEATGEIVIRANVTDDEAAEEIAALFDHYHGQTIYPSDVSEALRLDYDLVTRTIARLEADGKIRKS